ncbi:MAG: UDP-N-acetylmuramoyl-L-alanine--D-glutamate ligase [Halioglobus sp.]|nr:UDP-N-acetylmuramoyl-L-alanine--D-glutamate ligase [Halioglobus sp.]
MLLAKQTQVNCDNRIVVGLGATGLSCARHLHARGVPFSVLDTREHPPGLATLREEMPEVQFFSGDMSLRGFDGVGELVVSPGIGLDAPIVREARAVGVDVVGDIDLFMREVSAPVIGITGSNAKSTVTELVGDMARSAGVEVAVGGNLGTPALDLLDPGNGLYVLELSSFQLERSRRLGLAVATVLNISADHLDRHRSLSEYRRAKQRVFEGCGKVIVNRDDPQTWPLATAAAEVITWAMTPPGPGEFGLCFEAGSEYLSRGNQALLPVSELRLVGRHNIGNALAALALGHAVGLPLQAMVETLRVFSGLPHRCEYVAELAGVRYVNDSKGTNVGATEAALLGLGGERDIVLIAGGQGKGADFSLLRTAVSQHCKTLVLMGEDALLLQSALAESAPTVLAASFGEAFTVARAQAEPGDTVLLSPACASFDQFSGYAARGDAFRALVQQHMSGQS